MSGGLIAKLYCIASYVKSFKFTTVSCVEIYAVYEIPLEMYIEITNILAENEAFWFVIKQSLKTFHIASHV